MAAHQDAALLGRGSSLVGASEDQIAEAGMRGSARQVPFSAEMSAAFGTDFGGVQAFTGREASVACEALDARAYVRGNRAVFADSSPDRSVVAHELAHVVQQRGGSPSVMRKDRGPARAPVADLETQADLAAAEVLSGGRVTTPLSSAGTQVSRLRRFGTALYEPTHQALMGDTRPRVSRNDPQWRPARPTQDPEEMSPEEREEDQRERSETARDHQQRLEDRELQRQPLHGRTIPEWNTVLQAGGDGFGPSRVERHAWMMKATGQVQLGQVFQYGRGAGYRFVTIRGEPSEQEKISLARAMLHSGGTRRRRRGGGLLLNPPRPVGTFLPGQGSELVAEFLSRYTGPALEQRSEGLNEMDEDATERIQGFSRANEETGQHDSNAALLGSSLGTACKAAIEYLSTFLPGAAQPESQRPRYEELNVIHNAGATVGGVLGGIETYNAEQSRRAQTAWRATAAAFSVVSAGTVPTMARALYSAFFSMSTNYFNDLVRSGQPSASATRLIGDFRRTVREFAVDHNIEPNHYDACINQFESGIHNHGG